MPRNEDLSQGELTPDVIDLWNRAVDAEDAEDYQGAIENYDVLLCDSPDSIIALEAFYRLKLIIHSEYLLDESNLDDEQLAWLCCELACCQRICEIYEAEGALWPLATRAELGPVYSEIRTLLFTWEGRSGAWDQPVGPDLPHVGLAQTLRLLDCFSEKQLDAQGVNREVLLNAPQTDDEWKADVASEPEPQSRESSDPYEWPTIDPPASKAAGVTSEHMRFEADPVSEEFGDEPVGLKERAMEQGLAGRMRSLVGDLNILIRDYEVSTSAFSKKLDDAINRARQEMQQAELAFKSKKDAGNSARTAAIEKGNQILSRAQGYQKSALHHLETQSVYHDQAGLQLGGKFISSKDSIVQAEKIVTRIGVYVTKLHEIKKPENHMNVFWGLGIAGFLISICAAAGSARGDGGVVFFLVNGFFLGIAAAVMFGRNALVTTAMKSHYESIEKDVSEVESQIAAAIEYAKADYERTSTAANETHVRAKARAKDAEKDARSHFETNVVNFKSSFVPKVNELRTRFAHFYEDTGFVGMSWEDGSWNQWVPATAPALSASLGMLRSRKVAMLKSHFPDSLLDFAIPALVPFARGKDGRSLLLKCSGASKEAAAGTVKSVITRLLATVPPGKVRFTFVDPVGLGQNASAFMQLADFDESLVSGKAWTEPQHIEKELLELTEHMETVIQKYLRNDFESIEQYNENAGEIAEAYRVLVVWDFPVNFTDTAARRLVSIAGNGPRCGVYTIVLMDTSAEKRLPHGFTLGDLERTSNVIESSSGRFVWLDDYFKQHQLVLDVPPSSEFSKHVISMIGSVAKVALNVQVPYGKLLARTELTNGNWWRKTTEQVIEAPLGPHGANKIQNLILGEKTAHHAIVVGRTGSGKSNLMHVIITSLALRYSPEEIQLYLIDFKQGVEFKPYALVGLPHARVIAIESEREFGMSVLEGLDRELHQRGELFRAQNVNNIADYRKKLAAANGNSGPLPRILLLVDEFQEFFSQDDKISQYARLILDRLVRQGRSQGIHVMLGSQTLKGASDLPHNIISQMGIRIALQCTEADSRQIMGDDNPVHRQLTRPGEAIYNAESGQVEANRLFQVALFTEQDRDQYLGEITALAKTRKSPYPPPIVFEGNEPAAIELCAPLIKALDLRELAARVKSVDAWLGEPIAIRPPTSARFRRQGGNNLLVVSRDEEEGVGIVVSSLVSLFAQYRPDAARFFIFNLTTADSPWNEVPQELTQKFPHDIQVVGRKNLLGVLKSLVDEASERAENETAGTPELYFVVLGLHRARDLREDESDFSRYGKSDSLDARSLFLTLVREGPESGVHVITWCDAYAGLGRIDRRMLNEFSLRVAGPMSSDDSGRVIDDALASKLDKPHRAVFYDEDRPGQLEKFRPYAIPDTAWIDSVAKQMRNRASKAENA